MKRDIATSLISAVGLLTGMMTLAACEDRRDGGDRVEEAIDDAKDAADDAADDVKDAVDDAKDELNDAAERTQPR